VRAKACAVDCDCNLDGCMIETLSRGRGDADRADQTCGRMGCVVGINFDLEARQPLTDAKSVRTNGESAATSLLGTISPWGQGARRNANPNIEIFYRRLPEQLDLELDLENRVLYWTERGGPATAGNTVIESDPSPQRPGAGNRLRI